MKILIFVEKIRTIIYSYIISLAFKSCGKKFRIHYPSIICYSKSIEIGENVTIANNAWLNCKINPARRATLTIGKGTWIGRFVHINAFEKVIIEDNVLIADRVHISDTTHDYKDLDVPISKQGESIGGRVLIKSGSWLGVGCVILPGVTIGRNAVVGANAVVTKDVPDNYVARGVPAVNYPKGAKK